MTDINVGFCRAVLKMTMRDIAKVTTAAERRAAWVYNYHNGTWEFHAPAFDGLINNRAPKFYWCGRADNASDARHKGWSRWWTQLLDDPAALRARLEMES